MIKPLGSSDTLQGFDEKFNDQDAQLKGLGDKVQCLDE